MAAEQAVDLCPRHTTRPCVPERLDEGVQCAVPAGVPENKPGARLAVVPKAKRGEQVGRLYRPGAIHHGVEGREPQDVRLCAPEDPADEPLLAFGEVGVDLLRPEEIALLTPRDLAGFAAAELHRLPKLVHQLLVVLERAPAVR